MYAPPNIPVCSNRDLKEDGLIAVLAYRGVLFV